MTPPTQASVLDSHSIDSNLQGIIVSLHTINSSTGPMALYTSSLGLHIQANAANTYSYAGTPVQSNVLVLHSFNLEMSICVIDKSNPILTFANTDNTAALPTKQPAWLSSHQQVPL